MSKGSVTAKEFQIRMMLQDGMDPTDIIHITLPRVSLRDLQLYHQAFLNDKKNADANGFYNATYKKEGDMHVWQFKI